MMADDKLEHAVHIWYLHSRREQTLQKGQYMRTITIRLMGASQGAASLNCRGTKQLYHCSNEKLQTIDSCNSLSRESVQANLVIGLKGGPDMRVQHREFHLNILRPARK